MKEADSERWLKREAGKNKGCSESPAISPTIYGKTAAQGARAVPGCGVRGPSALRLSAGQAGPAPRAAPSRGPHDPKRCRAPRISMETQALSFRGRAQWRAA